MLYLMILLTILCLALLISLIALIRDIKYLAKQLEQIEQGSLIELTSLTRSKSILTLYRKLNQILDSFHKREIENLRSQKQLKQTISSIAHDIRTPLTSAAGYLQMLQENTCEEKLKRYEHIIEKRMEELKNMLEELFLYTKLTSPDFTLECHKIAVFPVLSEIMIGMFHLFEEKDCEPTISFQQEDLYVDANAEALGRIFRNLIHNSLLHGNGGLMITQENHTICFSNLIDDQNHDIPIDTSLLFDRFYKADQARRKGSSGLGLAIVKELMERMDGSVSAALDGNMLSIYLNFQNH